MTVTRILVKNDKKFAYRLLNEFIGAQSNNIALTPALFTHMCQIDSLPIQLDNEQELSWFKQAFQRNLLHVFEDIFHYGERAFDKAVQDKQPHVISPSDLTVQSLCQFFTLK
jgi:hypothetical protein